MTDYPLIGQPTDYYYDPVEPDEDYTEAEQAVRRALHLWYEDDETGGMGGGGGGGGGGGLGGGRPTALFPPQEGPAE